MKKSVIAAVAASNMTIFSGLVNAEEEFLSGDGGTILPACVFRVDALPDLNGQPTGLYTCYLEHVTLLPCITGTEKCYSIDDQGLVHEIIVKCGKHEKPSSGQLCNMPYLPE